MSQRLSKVLAGAGIASRRACEELIFRGKVSVNGVITRLPQTRVDPTRDRLLVQGKPLAPPEEKLYFLLHKPAGWICTTVQKRGGARRVLDLFSHLPYRLFTVGRLDQETEGLLLVTNDGLFAHHVIHPSFAVSKEYLAKTGQEITHAHLLSLSQGGEVEGEWVRPLAVKKVRKGTVKITIAEGKKHEVRLLLTQAGLTIRSLTRIRVGPLTLGNLTPGMFRSLTPAEVAHFLIERKK